MSVLDPFTSEEFFISFVTTKITQFVRKFREIKIWWVWKYQASNYDILSSVTSSRPIRL